MQHQASCGFAAACCAVQLVLLIDGVAGAPTDPFVYTSRADDSATMPPVVGWSLALDVFIIYLTGFAIGYAGWITSRPCRKGQSGGLGRTKSKVFAEFPEREGRQQAAPSTEEAPDDLAGFGFGEAEADTGGPGAHLDF